MQESGCTTRFTANWWLRVWIPRGNQEIAPKFPDERGPNVAVTEQRRRVVGRFDGGRPRCRVPATGWRSGAGPGFRRRRRQNRWRSHWRSMKPSRAVAAGASKKQPAAAWLSVKPLHAAYLQAYNERFLAAVIAGRGSGC